MAKNYRLSDEAELDIEDGYKWYESKQVGLGEEFLQCLDQARASILSNPTSYRIRYRNKVCGFVVSRFPYLILYIVNKGNIDVISVFNTHQHPKRWEIRM